MPARDMYVVKLSFSQYRDFAQWITEDVSGTRRYQLPPGQLNNQIETKLKSYPAKVHEHCDGTGPVRNFGKDEKDNDWNRDNVTTHPDSMSSANRMTNMAMPTKICETSVGGIDIIDIKYLENYISDIRNEPNDTNAAWSLLGMYFLSRCR